MNEAEHADVHTRSAAGARSVLFVCLGNICRSPLAQGVFEHLAESRGVRDELTIESCGTGSWHVGDPPDPRSLEVARKNGITLDSIGRLIDPRRDFDRFRLIIPMDRSNRRNILTLGGPADRTHLLRAFDPSWAGNPAEAPEVPDPYHDDLHGFDRVYAMIRTSCEGLLDAMLRP